LGSAKRVSFDGDAIGAAGRAPLPEPAPTADPDAEVDAVAAVATPRGADGPTADFTAPEAPAPPLAVPPALPTGVATEAVLPV
jgi:hypothetical protein